MIEPEKSTAACSACGAALDGDGTACFLCGHARRSPPLKKGQVIADRYELLGVLGRGGMGTVYEAHDRSLDERVALKVLSETGQGSADADRRFRSEIKLARKIRHPNVCAIHEYGELQDVQYIVMEFVDGQDLKKYLRSRGMLTPDEAIDIARQIGEGLQAIHDAGVIHRDLKLANVMRDSHGRLRLMDFGIAKGMCDTVATATGQILGTPEYMSPEQVQGQGVDARADIYSLGVMTYELLTGRVPFKADTPLGTIMLLVNEPPRLDDPAIPPALVPVLKKALAKKPEARYDSAREFVAALAASVSLWTSPGPPASPPPFGADEMTIACGSDSNPPSIAPTGAPRSPLSVAVGLLLTLVLVGLIVSKRDRSPETPVVSAQPTPRAPSVRPLLPAGLVGDRVDCMVAGRFSLLHLQAPADLKPEGRLYFKSNLSPEYFFTGLDQQGPAWQAFVPKINRGGGIREITYYFSVSSQGSTETLKTDPQTARVIDQESQCPPGGRVAEEGKPLGAVSVLSTVGDDLVLPIAEAFGFQALSGGLKDPDPEVRLATAQSLAEMVGLIVRVIDDAVSRLRSQGSFARERAGKDLAVTARQAVRGTVEALIAALHDKNPDTRRSVGATLGRLGRALAQARSALSACLRDSDKDVRVSATQALTAIGPVVTTTAAALRSAENQEEDDKTSEVMGKALRDIETGLAEQGRARKQP